MRSAARCIAAAVIVLATATVAAAQTSDVVFVNDTGATIYFLYASPTTADSWGEDLLESAILPDGESLRVRLRAAPAFDIRAVDSDDNEYLIWNWPSRSRRVVIARDAFVGVPSSADSDAVAWLKIWNETNYTVEQVIVVPAGSDGWDGGEPLLEPRQAILHGEFLRVEIDVERFDTFVYDIMLIDEDGDRYIKEDVNLELVGELLYTLDDIRF